MAKRDYAQTPETLLESILAMQDKLIETTPAYRSADLTYEAEMSDGRIITRVNPLVQEYRALLKDYGNAIKTYKEITGDSDQGAAEKLDGLRMKFKIAP